MKRFIKEDSVDIPLTITVSDNGFSMEDGTYSNNRAFSAGDRIGLFALMNGEILDGFKTERYWMASITSASPHQAPATPLYGKPRIRRCCFPPEQSTMLTGPIRRPCLHP